MNENKNKVSEQVKSKVLKKDSTGTTNPLSKRLNSLNKTNLTNLNPAKTTKSEQKESTKTH